MRSLTITLAAAVGLSACAGTGGWQPVSLSGPTRVSGDAAAECVRNEVRDMGYEVATGQSSGAITGIRRNEVSWYLRPLGFRPTIDQIDARIEQGQLRVTAASSVNIAEGPATGQRASDDARRNAEQLLRECGR
jgi:hypothetical protein